MNFKLAITKSNIDLLRIIPSVKKKVVDFKICTLEHEYYIEYWAQSNLNPERHVTSKEITYHSSINSKSTYLPGTIHIKEKENNEIIYKHKFPKVIDLSLNTEFPIPLVKLEINDLGDKLYKNKKEHIIYDIKNNNTLEIYIITKSFDNEIFMKKWRFIDILWNITTIDYLLEGVQMSKQFLDKLYGHGDNILKEMHLFNNFNLIFRSYKKDVKCNKIVFYENYDYLDMLATTPICLIDGITKKRNTPVSPAFTFDLEYQLREGTSKKITDKWARFFEKGLYKLKSKNIKRIIFAIPQYNDIVN